jgi:hypothetical protein
MIRQRAVIYGRVVFQDDWPEFIKAMQKEVAHHEQLKHWHWKLVHISTIPPGFKRIKDVWIWSFKRKRTPNGELLKHKARLCCNCKYMVKTSNLNSN